MPTIWRNFTTDYQYTRVWIECSFICAYYKYNSDVCPCRCICTYNSIVINLLAPISKRKENKGQFSIKDRNLSPARFLSPSMWKLNFKFYLRTKTCFSVRSQSPGKWKPNFKFYLRTKTCFSVRSRSLGGWKPNLKFQLRIETCFSVRSQSPSRCKPNFKFYLRIETGSQLDLHHRTDGNLTSSYSKNRNKLPSFILVTRHIVNASNYSWDWN